MKFQEDTSAIRMDRMKKNVRFIIGTLSTGGAERTVSNLSLKLNESFNKEIVLFGKKASIDYAYKGKLMYLDKIDEDKNIGLKLLALFSRLNKLKTLKRKDHDTVNISFLEYPNVLNLLTKGKTRNVISVRNHMSTKHTRGKKAILWKSTIKYMYNKADQIIAVSEEIKKDLVQNYAIQPEKIKVIYNSYNIHEIKTLSNDSLEAEYRDIFKKPVIITAGRLDKQKGQWHLIRIFNDLVKSDSEVQLVILGRGKIEDKLLELVASYKLEDRVHFLGFQSNPFKFISKASVFVLSSNHEGFPNALAEAMACNVPVISTDCMSGPREMLAPDEFHINNETFIYGYENNRFGILTPNITEETFNSHEDLTTGEIELKKGIVSILQDESLSEKLKQKAFERISQFDIDKTIMKWEEILQK